MYGNGKESPPTVKVPSGTVPATHRHPEFGYCIVMQSYLHCIAIRTNTGTAIVPQGSLEKLR